MTHSIEFLKKAREVGAEYYDSNFNFFYKIIGYGLFVMDAGSNSNGWLSSCSDVNDFMDEYTFKIDFSPLDDYYADKDIDVKATGVSE